MRHNGNHAQRLLLVLTVAAITANLMTDAYAENAIPVAAVIEEQALPSNVLSTQNAGNKEEAPPTASPTPEAIPPKPETIPEKPAPRLRPALPPVKAADVPPPPKLPDETPLWALLKEGRFETTLDTVAHLRRQYPAWQPPAQLLQLAQEGRQRQQIEDAIARKDHAMLAKLAEEIPQAFTCEHIDWAWALAEAYAALSRPADALNVAHKLVPGCPKEEDRLATLFKAKAWLDVASWESLLAAEESAPRSESGNAAFRRLQYDTALEHLTAADQRKDNSQQVKQQFESIETDIASYRDAGTALIGAWNYYRMEDYPSAKHWFTQALTWDSTRHDARQGIALCQIKEFDYSGAYANAEALPPEMSGRNELLRDARLGQAQTSYDAKDYGTALARLKDAAQHAELPRYVRMLQGWSLFQLGQMDKAADTFSALYREQADQQSAEGVLNSMLKANRQEELNTLAASGPLADMLKSYYGRKWFDEKHFLAARDESPEMFGELGAVAAPRVTLLDGRREKSGQSGSSKLTQQVTGLEAAWPLSPAAEIRLKLEHVTLDNGAYDTGGWQPTLAWLHESSDTSFRLQAGLTPNDGPISPRLVGEASMQRNTLWGNYEIAVYMRPVKESVLSYVGDPNNSNHGQVVRNGGNLSAYRSLGGNWAANGKLTLENLTGEKVKSNDHFATEGGISYDLKPEGFDYLALGFSLGYEHYAHNLSLFNPGHGGYFSPQEYWHWGPALDFMTAENKPLLVKGHFSVGGFYKREDDTSLFPLLDSSPKIAGSHGTGKTYNADVQGVWRINNYLQLGAAVTKRYAPGYSDFSTFGFLRILFEPRKSVLSADLPGEMSESVY